MKTPAPSEANDEREIDGANNSILDNISCVTSQNNGNLIKCNSHLASSFYDVKCNKSKIKPGQYLQKVLLGKLKSQSVPSLDNENPPTTSHIELTVDESETSGEENKEDWYKTWPDCLEKDKLKNGLREESPTKVSVNPNTPTALKDVYLPLAYSPITKKLHLIEPKLVLDVQEDCRDKSERNSTEASSLSDDLLPCQSDNNDFSSIGNCSLASEDEGTEKPKRRGLSSFFSKGVFSWKIRDHESWNPFSRSESSSSADQQSVGSDHGVVGSSGLVLWERPAWLPAKSAAEHQAHAEEHDKILESNRKKNVKDTKLRVKLLQQQLKAEEETAQATKTWTQDIFPKWATVRNQKKTLELWWRGIPPCVRGKVWKLAISNDLNITHDLFNICLSRANERLKDANSSRPESEHDRVHSMELIQLDINRTFPNLCIFQKSGPYYEMLHDVLAAYVCYRPDVGYVQGMSFIAAVLILNMDAPDSFVCFANILNQPLHRAFFALDQTVMKAYYSTYSMVLNENLPALHKHLDQCNLTPDLYLFDWLYTIFAKATHLDLASRLWDVFLRDGEEFLFRSAVGILKMFETELLTMDFITGSKFLTRLPKDVCAIKLFKCISHVKMNVGKLTFQQILLSQTHPN